MVSNELLYFLPVILGIVLVIVGMDKKDQYTGMFGGLILFITGVSLSMNPTSLPSLINDILGTGCWGYGMYVILRGALEEMDIPGG